MTNAPAASLLRRTRVRVRYAETDRMGVVYYANYFVWFEIGRTDWLRDTGHSYRAMEEDGVQLPVIEAHCEYRRPAKYDDDLEVRTRATLVTPVRIRFDYEILRGDETLVVGHTIHAALDSRGRPCRLPSRIREMIGHANDLAGPTASALHATASPPGQTAKRSAQPALAVGSPRDPTRRRRKGPALP